MKLTNLLVPLATIGLLAGVSRAADRPQPPLTVTISVTSISQDSENDNGTNTTFKAKRQLHGMADLLNVLAQDEYAAGNYATNKFPVGSRLVYSDGGFQVMKGTNVLVVVTNILTAGGSDNSVKSGRQRDATGLANPLLIKYSNSTLTFDDTAIAGGQNLQFSFTGASKQTVVDVVHPVAGTYTETFNFQLTSGVGEGRSEGTNVFFVIGSLHAAGTATFSLPPPP
jgi:hypothetical protein